jgi:hypothetical protein
MRLSTANGWATCLPWDLSFSLSLPTSVDSGLLCTRNRCVSLCLPESFWSLSVFSTSFSCRDNTVEVKSRGKNSEMMACNLVEGNP